MPGSQAGFVWGSGRAARLQEELESTVIDLLNRSLLTPAVVLGLVLGAATSARADEEDETDDNASAPMMPLRAGDYYTTRFGELTKELGDRIASPRAAATLYRIGQIADSLDSLAPVAQVFQRAAD